MRMIKFLVSTAAALALAVGLGGVAPTTAQAIEQPTARCQDGTYNTAAKSDNPAKAHCDGYLLVYLNGELIAKYRKGALSKRCTALLGGNIILQLSGGEAWWVKLLVPGLSTADSILWNKWGCDKLAKKKYKTWYYIYGGVPTITKGDMKLTTLKAGVSTTIYAPTTKWRLTFHSLPGLKTPVGKTVKDSYQWYRDGEAIKGATHASYQLRVADRVGCKIWVEVVGKRAKYVTARNTSQKVTLI